MGDSYKLSTLEECALLYVQLSGDARERFLDELKTLIAFTGLSMQLYAECGAPVRWPSTVWTDDGVKHITAKIQSTPNEKEEIDE